MGQFTFTIPKYTGKCQSVDGVTYALDTTNSFTPPQGLDPNISREENMCMNWCEIEKQTKRREGIEITGCQFEHDDFGGSCNAIIDLFVGSGDGDMNYTCWDLPCKLSYLFIDLIYLFICKLLSFYHKIKL